MKTSFKTKYLKHWRWKLSVEFEDTFWTEENEILKKTRELKLNNSLLILFNADI